MIEDTVSFIAMGFCMSFILYFQGQAARLFVEAPESTIKR